MATRRQKVPRTKLSPKRAAKDRFPLIEKALKELTKPNLGGLVIRLSKAPELSRALDQSLTRRNPLSSWSRTSNRRFVGQLILTICE